MGWSELHLLKKEKVKNIAVKHHIAYNTLKCFRDFTYPLESREKESTDSLPILVML